MYKFDITKDGYFTGISSNGIIPMDDIFNLNNLPTLNHKWNGTTWVLDEVKYKESLLKEVQELRADEYPPVTDQLDEIMKWLATETEFGIPEKLKSIAMQCMAVKSKYPKPEGDK